MGQLQSRFHVLGPAMAAASFLERHAPRFCLIEFHPIEKKCAVFSTKLSNLAHAGYVFTIAADSKRAWTGVAYT
jgi:hypothetical protein